MKKHVSIIGAGKIGSAIKKLLMNNKNISLLMWDKDETRVSGQQELKHVVSSADFIFICIPSWVLPAALTSFTHFLKKDTVVISVTKGIVSLPASKGKTAMKVVPHLFDELLPKAQSYALLSGPMLADELEQGRIGAATLAAKRNETYQKIKPLFKNSNLILEYCSDVFGVALCSVLKNMYAIILGISDGLELGYNTRGYLVSTALKEMEIIVSVLGGKKTSAFTYAGLGDLIATGSSMHSRNYTVGKELALHGECTTESEGRASLQALFGFLKGRSSQKELPLLYVLSSILLEKKEVKKTVKHYFDRVK